MLIKTIDELKQYVNADKNLSPASFGPSIQKAEDQYISVVLGQAQLAELQTAYDNNTLSAIQIQLLDQVRKAEASLAMYLLVPVLSVRIGDAGVLVAGGADQQRAMQWQVDDLRNQFLFDGYNALDNLYNFLFANQGLFPEWQASDAYNEFTQYFINTVKDFQKEVDIDNSNWIFRRLIAIMENLEISNILLTIGESFFDYLKAQITANTLAGDDLIAVQMLRKAIAPLTYSRALLDPNFTEVISIFQRPRSDAQDRRKWVKPDYSMLAETFRGEGENMLERAKKFFNATASPTVYAAYYTSDRYRQPHPDDKFKHDEFDNRNSTGSFMFL